MKSCQCIEKQYKSICGHFNTLPVFQEFIKKCWKCVENHYQRVEMHCQHIQNLLKCISMQFSLNPVFPNRVTYCHIFHLFHQIYCFSGPILLNSFTINLNVCFHPLLKSKSSLFWYPASELICTECHSSFVSFYQIYHFCHFNKIGKFDKGQHIWKAE